MVDSVTYLIVAATAFLIIAGTIFLSYWVPKRLGYRKIGMAISSILTLGMLILLMGQFVLKDYLFFKSDAKEFLSNHSIILNDNFEITYNDNDELLDSYQNFILKISPSDRMRIIESITSSDNFGKKDSIAQPDNSFRIINYEDDYSFVRKSTQTFGAHEISVIGIVQLDKNKNTLTCYKYIP